MQGVNALAEIASSLPDFIGGASRNDDGGQTSSRFFSGEPRRDTRNDEKNCDARYNLVNKCELLTNKSPNLHVNTELYLLILLTCKGCANFR
jgi:hypothetical protein